MRETSTLTTRVGSYTCSSNLGKIILHGMNEIIGTDDTLYILDQGAIHSLAEIQDPNALDASVPYRQISRLLQTMESHYGERGGQGLSQRMGQAAFRCGLREMGWGIGLYDPKYRLLPPYQKLQVGARYLASAFNSLSDQRVYIEEGFNCFSWVVKRCPLCWGRHADGSICHFTVGFLQEFVSWSTGGKSYGVVESECIAAGGSNCVFTIEKHSHD